MATSSSRVLRHIVLFAFKPDATAAEVKAVEEGFAGLPARIPEIIGFEWGHDVSVESKAAGFTHCFIVTFADEAARDAYLPHPAHQEFVALVSQHREKGLVLDYWTQAS
jgi:hypothetical protein